MRRSFVALEMLPPPSITTTKRWWPLHRRGCSRASGTSTGSAPTISTFEPVTATRHPPAMRTAASRTTCSSNRSPATQFATAPCADRAWITASISRTTAAATIAGRPMRAAERTKIIDVMQTAGR